MSFSTTAFWLSLYMQNVLRYSPLEVAVHLLPQAIGGIIVNIIAGLILHRVDNKILTGLGALSYVGSSLLLANIKEGSSYWAFIFPSLLLSVVGADLQFNVANVSTLSPFRNITHSPIFKDVRDVLPPTAPTIPRGRDTQHRDQDMLSNRTRYLSQYLQCGINR